MISEAFSKPQSQVYQPMFEFRQGGRADAGAFCRRTCFRRRRGRSATRSRTHTNFCGPAPIKGRMDWSLLRADTNSKKEPAAAADIVVEDDDDEPDRDALGSPVSKICFGKVRCATLLLVKIWVACANSDIEQYIFLRPRQGPQANSDIEQSALLRPRQGPQVFFFIRTHYSPFFHHSKTIPW